jgi:hypothetical protein
MIHDLALDRKWALRTPPHGLCGGSRSAYDVRAPFPPNGGSAWIWFQAERRCAETVQLSFGGISEAGGALPRFGLDIGRGTSGWVDGADAVWGHPRFLREASMPPERPVIRIIRLRRCRPEAHRAQPPRTPDARSFRVAAHEIPSAFPPRPCDGTVHEIAHRVKPDGGLRGALERTGFPKKMRMAPAALPSGPRSNVTRLRARRRLERSTRAGPTSPRRRTSRISSGEFIRSTRARPIGNSPPR